MKGRGRGVKGRRGNRGRRRRRRRGVRFKRQIFSMPPPYIHDRNPPFFARKFIGVTPDDGVFGGAV
jgi:hypothetical protein